MVTDAALATCAHLLGIVSLVAGQGLVRISGDWILVRPAPQARPIRGCPNIGVGIKPCTATLAVTGGHSEFVRIDGRPVCLDAVTGRTDGTPPGTVTYGIRRPGQSFVTVAT